MRTEAQVREHLQTSEAELEMTKTMYHDLMHNKDYPGIEGDISQAEGLMTRARERIETLKWVLGERG